MDFYPSPKCLFVDRIKEHSEVLAPVPSESVWRCSCERSAEPVSVGMFGEREVGRVNRK